MSRDFPGSASNDLSRADTSFWSPAAGFAVAAWVYRDANVETAAVSKWQGSADRSFILYVTTGGVVSLASLQSNNVGASASKSGFSNSAWQHIGFEFQEGVNVFRCWLNGVAGADSAGVTFGIKDSSVAVRIGSSADDGTKRWWDGAIADVCAWSTGALGADAWGAMAKGVPARMIRPEAILSYVPLWGAGTTEPDLSGNGGHFTVNGTLNQRDHGPVGCPFPVAT